jgi:hypothetical protein
MTGELDIHGVFLPSYAALALFTYGMFRLLASFLEMAGVYRLVWHRSLFNLALYVTLLGGFSVTANWF